MDDDIMLNVVGRNKPKSQSKTFEDGNKKISKTDLKKMKYSSKLKQKNKMGRGKSQSE